MDFSVCLQYERKVFLDFFPLPARRFLHLQGGHTQRRPAVRRPGTGLPDRLDVGRHRRRHRNGFHRQLDSYRHSGSGEGQRLDHRCDHQKGSGALPPGHFPLRFHPPFRLLAHTRGEKDRGRALEAASGKAHAGFRSQGKNVCRRRIRRQLPPGQRQVLLH